MMANEGALQKVLYLLVKIVKKLCIVVYVNTERRILMHLLISTEGTKLLPHNKYS